MKTQMILVLSLLLAITLTGCGPEFDDDRQSLLLKPELLSIVLEPPEAAPGELVTASFLFADQNGVSDEVPLNFWLPADLLAGDPGDLNALSSRFGLSLADLVGPTLSFTVPAAEEYVFDMNDMAAQQLSLFVQSDELPGELGNDPRALAAELMRLIEEDRLEPGVRTLAVSQRAERNRNPRITRISLVDETGNRSALDLVRSHDSDIAAGRLAAMSNPIVIESGAPVVFEAEIEDEGDLETSIRYQWVSTAGDFDGYRLRDEPWQAPEYREPVGSDPDSNLYPVWLIVRDSGVEYQLGQSWAEFYVRIQEPIL